VGHVDKQELAVWVRSGAAEHNLAGGVMEGLRASTISPFQVQRIAVGRYFEVLCLGQLTKALCIDNTCDRDSFGGSIER
jgi:hypothetical protein